jgi:hypothetical protein
MDYAKLKLDSELSKIPSDRQKLEKGDLLKIINNQRELIRWYENQVEYHREKATAFIPNYAMRKVTQNREKENESLERLFVRGGC